MGFRTPERGMGGRGALSEHLCWENAGWGLAQSPSFSSASRAAGPTAPGLTTASACLPTATPAPGCKGVVMGRQARCGARPERSEALQMGCGRSRGQEDKQGQKGSEPKPCPSLQTGELYSVARSGFRERSPPSQL